MNIFGINLGNSDLWLLGAAGVCLAWLIPHRLALWRERRARLLYAGDSIYASFSDTLAKLRNGQEDPFAILEQQFHAHESAVLEFARYLGHFKRKRFMKAWYDYYCQDGDPSIPFLEQYSMHLGSIELAKTNRKVAIQRIEHFLSYAKHT